MAFLTDDSVKLPTTIKQAAARWHIKLAENANDASLQADFIAWLQANPLHQQAYHLVQETMHDFDSAERLKNLDNALNQQKRHHQNLQRKKLTGLATALTVACITLGFSWFAHQQYQAWQAAPVMQLAQSSGRAQIVSQTLQDGSKITLGASTQLDVTYYRHARKVTLKQGEAIFEVAKDSARPFTVQAGQATVTVLGTRFAVNKFSHLVRVSVDHGRVQLQSAGKQPVILQNGQVAELDTNSAPLRVNKVAADAFSFKDGTINFDQASLAEIAQTLTRYTAKPVVAGLAKTNSPHVSAVFKTKDTYQFIQDLPQHVPVLVQSTPTQITISAK